MKILENQNKARKPRHANRNQSRQAEFVAHATIELSGIDKLGILNEDIISEYLPTKGKYIRFFDDYSTFLKSMNTILQSSFTLSRIVTDQARLIAGNGFIVNEGKSNSLVTSLRKLFKKISGNDERINVIDDLLRNVNQSAESLYDVIYKLSYDYVALGNCVCEIVVNNTVGSVSIYHHDLSNIGLKTDSNDRVSSIGVSKNWAENKTITDLPIYPNFSGNEKSEIRRTAVHLKNYAPSLEYWGLPDWISAKLYANLEYRIAKYNVTKFKNSFVPSGVLQVFGNFSKKEADKLINDITSKFTDTGNNSKILIQVLREHGAKLNWQSLSDEGDGAYMDLAKLTSQALVTSLGWTMSLAGFTESGKLGSNQQLSNELNFVNQTKIQPIQNLITSNIISPYFETLKSKNTGLNKLSIGISKYNLINLASETEINQALTTNEKRQLLGYENIEGGDLINNNNTNL